MQTQNTCCIYVSLFSGDVTGGETCHEVIYTLNFDTFLWHRFFQSVCANAENLIFFVAFLIWFMKVKLLIMTVHCQLEVLNKKIFVMN